jgi:hypothetical protein
VTRAGALVGAFAAAVVATGCTVDARVATVTDDGGAVPPSQFHTLGVGAPLLDEATCAERLRRMPAEPRPTNVAANHHAPTPAEVARLAPWDATNAYADAALALEARITGDFTGTTDEILQWAACKWGFDEDVVRAEALESTSWRQGVQTDWTATPTLCPADAATRPFDGGVECAQTYGMFQVVWQYHQTAWPMYRDSTAFHVDLVFGLRRACFEGYDLSQASRAPAGRAYAAGDEWGCLGAHFSGAWYDDGAKTYIQHVRERLAARAWTRPDFPEPP